MNLLAPLLTLETVRLNLDVVSRKRLYEEAGLVFETSAGLSHTEAFDALFAREKLGSTCLGSGCALPHGRVEGITEPAAVFLRTAAPLSLDAPDGRPVQLFLCLLIPENDDGMYLKILREAACLFGNKPLPIFRCIAMFFIILGSTLKLDLVWQLADFFNGIMVIPNLIAVIGLAKVVSNALNDFDEKGQLKA